MLETPPTRSQTLLRARQIAVECGLQYVYVGNVADSQHQSTYCPACGKRVIERRVYDVPSYELHQNQCRWCGHVISGHSGDGPGHWGTKRMPVDPAALLRSLETTDV